MTGDPLVSYAIATYGRPDELEEALDSVVAQSYRPLEVVVVGDTSEEVTALFEGGRKFDEDWIHFEPLSERNGPAHAKNVGFELATGDVIVHIDDDATLGDPDVTDRAVSLLRAYDDVGVLAFQSRNHETGEIVRMEIPDPPDFETPPTEQYLTTGFIGVGTAFRRSALESAGLYPDDFEYGFEEMDLAIRILDAGYDILYDPWLVVYHKKSQNARRPELESIEFQVENRIRLAVRNLPWRYVACSTAVWLAYAFLRSGLNPSSVGRIVRRLGDEWRTLVADRSVVDDATISLVKSRSSMLFGWLYGPHPRRIIGPNGNLRRLTW